MSEGKWRNGRRAGFRCLLPQGSGGSTPLLPTSMLRKWSPKLAYAIGLIATDGNLAKDGRHINLTSKDEEQVIHLKAILGLTNTISLKKGSYTSDVYYFLQFGDVELYSFLAQIGLTPNKSKTIRSVTVPDKYFADFLRGCLDGDGYTYSYWDKRWKANYRLYTGFVSASLPFLIWLKNQIARLYRIVGSIRSSGKTIFQLEFAKKSSILLLKILYYDPNLVCLSRKRFKAEVSLGIIEGKPGC